MRDWRLYDETGRRYTDFYQYDGAAFLGHRPRGVAQTVAAEIDRGLWSAVPTAWTGRFTQALEALAVAAGVARLVVVAPGVPAPGVAEDSTVRAGSGDAAKTSDARWRPLGAGAGAVAAAGTATATGTAAAAGTAAVPGAAAGGATDSAPDDIATQVVLPLPIALPHVPGTVLLPPEELSVALVAGLTRAVWSLIRYLDSPGAAARLELAGSLPAPPGYRRHGVYFIREEESAAEDDRFFHARCVQRAWNHSIVLPPHPAIPLCVPGELGRVELQMWEALCRDWPR